MITVRSGDGAPYSMKAKWEAEEFMDEVKPRNRDNCSDLENDIRCPVQVEGKEPAGSPLARSVSRCRCSKKRVCVAAWIKLQLNWYKTYKPRRDTFVGNKSKNL